MAAPSLKSHQKQAVEFDARNLRMAKRVLADPDTFPHLLGWAAAVMQRLGAKANNSRETKPDGLFKGKADG